MAVQMSEEQFQQLMIRVEGQSQVRIPRHFTQCSARFNGTRSAAALEEFVTAATIYKKVEGTSDEDALKGLPLLLTGTEDGPPGLTLRVSFVQKLNDRV
jgi:hypothetical protein